MGSTGDERRMVPRLDASQYDFTDTVLAKRELHELRKELRAVERQRQEAIDSQGRLRSKGTVREQERAEEKVAALTKKRSQHEREIAEQERRLIQMAWR